MEWQFRAVHPGKYTLSAEIASPASPSVELRFGSKTWRVTIPNTGSYTSYKAIDLGAIDIKEVGMATLSVAPVADGWKPFNLRKIRMAPAAIR